MTREPLTVDSSLSRKRLRPNRLVAMLLALFIIVWASPSEQTLGNLVKVVYVHGALVRATQLVFVAGGVMGAVYLLKKTALAVSWSWALQKVGFIYLLLSFVSSLYMMSASWGGINWTEPRFVAIGRIFAASAIAMALNFLLQKPKIVALTGIFMVAIVSLEIATAGVVLHPDNPIGTSPSMMTKVYYYAILLLVVLITAEIARLLLPTKADQERTG